MPGILREELAGGDPDRHSGASVGREPGSGPGCVTPNKFPNFSEFSVFPASEGMGMSAMISKVFSAFETL